MSLFYVGVGASFHSAQDLLLWPEQSLLQWIMMSVILLFTMVLIRSTLQWTKAFAIEIEEEGHEDDDERDQVMYAPISTDHPISKAILLL